MNNNNYEKALEFYNNEEYEKAYEIFEKLALEGNPDAQFNLALMYVEGQGVEQDYSKAVYWYTKSAEQGMVYAQHNLALMYVEGQGVEQDYSKAVYWYTKSAEQGIVGDQTLLGSIYSVGKGIKRDDVKAFYWYKKAAENGDERAQSNLGVFYELGRGVEVDNNRAKYWYEMAAAKNLSTAQYNLGWLYSAGKCGGVDYSTAKLWYEKAAKQNHIGAIHSLGKLFYHGLGVEKNYKDAILYFNKALKLGFCREANYYLGECYYYGYGVEVDLCKAKENYQQAVDYGYNCRYALEMVKRDLDEYDTTNGIQKYAKETISKKLFPSDLILKIRKDLEKDFGEYWIQLKENAQKALISGVFSYINFYSLGEEYYKDLDFTPCITAMSKALETELAEFFFRYYLDFLKKKGVSPNEFNEKQCFIKTDKNKCFFFEENDNLYRFSLGSLWYILEVKLGENGTKGGTSNISKYMVEFADGLFKKDAFSIVNREKEIVRYLIDLASDVRDIKKIRNPAAHSDTMTCAQAEVCGDYLIKVRKLICNILSKIKDEYK